ncbi:3-oxoacyl-ACP reductase [Bdellovibrio bacteriovorus]|uniref:3-oxoacyl-ACP reductase n=1 Tax=Bdellovibrio bacteriovorus TaxID=959 RepID=A0A150WPW2_BDEBC|nr:SDR family oxidoreductase [Bdellovibrio bacteriovorus]KYG66428.1 3-oxoacyl-ACP reductase [Bdellovibrio bacteriovorus]
MAKGRVVIVTGAGSGIGEATAKRFLKEGAKVAVCDKDFGKLKKAFADYPPDSILLAETDVSREGLVESFVKQVMQKFDHIDVLVNNAGIYYEGTISETPTEQWRKVMDTDVDGVFYMSRACLPYLKKSKGNIINISSLSGLGGDPEAAAYNAAKGAITNLTRAMAIDHGKEGVRVNAICPTFTKTDLTADMFKDKELVKDMVDRIPMGRYGMPEDIASAVYLLASEDAHFITGVNLPVDGGAHASNGQAL